MVIQTWTDVTVNAFQVLWQGFINFLPQLIGALIVFFVGWAIAAALGKLISQIIKTLRVDQVLEKIGLGQICQKVNIDLDCGKWLGTLVKWFLIIVFLMAATDILGLEEITRFLRGVLNYIPNVIVAMIVLLVGVWVAELLQKLVKASVGVTQIKAANLLAAITRWSIMIFAFLTALMQLGVAYVLINTLVTGLVAMLALAGGLAFGLGGKDQAARFLDGLKKEISER